MMEPLSKTTSEAVSRRVMRRVYCLCFCRQLFSRRNLFAAGWLLAVWQFFQRVSVFDVWQNTRPLWRAGGVNRYLLESFLRTEGAVQLLTFLLLGLALWLAKDIVFWLVRTGAARKAINSGAHP